MKPILPEPSIDAGSRQHRTLIRSMISLAAAHGGGDALGVAQRRWQHDRATQDYLQRGPATITSTTTATALTSTILALVPLLGPLSASGNVLKRALQLTFDGAGAINIPDAIPSGTGVAFVGQGQPFPVRQLIYSPQQLVPRKLALGTAGTRELFENSNAEAVISNNVAADFSLGLETILFDATPADAVRPAGLKNSIAASTADTGTDVTAMFNDLASLAASVAVVGGMNFGYIASPKQAIKIALRKSTNNFPFPISASSALPDKQVCALAFDALAVAGDAAPRFETSKVATVHMSTTPSELATAGTPNTVAAPTSSLFQEDLIGIKLIADISWVLRSASGFAWINAVNW